VDFAKYVDEPVKEIYGKDLLSNPKPHSKLLLESESAKVRFSYHDDVEIDLTQILGGDDDECEPIVVSHAEFMQLAAPCPVGPSLKRSTSQKPIPTVSSLADLRRGRSCVSS
jgi:hypothetical protein